MYTKHNEKIKEQVEEILADSVAWQDTYYPLRRSDDNDESDLKGQH
jgi:hypothetical protein